MTDDAAPRVAPFLAHAF